MSWCVRRKAAVTSFDAFSMTSSWVSFSFDCLCRSALCARENRSSLSLRRAASALRFACNWAVRKSPLVLVSRRR